MSAKAMFTTALVGIVLGLGSASAQTPPTGSETPLPTPRLTAGPGASETPVTVTSDHPGAGLSDWITYCRGGRCMGPAGGDPPFSTELYLRPGISVPFGGEAFSRIMDSGWSLEGGGRLFFFDDSMDRAWVVDVGMSYHYNHAHGNENPFPLSVILTNAAGAPQRVNFGQNGLPGVTVRDFNRTFVDLGIGREYYLSGAANQCGQTRWRTGWDFGGRYGSGSVDLNELRHRVDVIGGVYAGLHSDIEVPCGCCTFIGGLRTEWAYTWSDIMQRKDDLEEVVFLVDFGVRY